MVEDYEKAGARKIKSSTEEEEMRGFTLIELLIVIALLGVLAAVIIPHVGACLAG